MATNNQRHKPVISSTITADSEPNKPNAQTTANDDEKEPKELAKETPKELAKETLKETPTEDSKDNTIDSLDFNLSERVETKLREVIPSNDPLDSSTFNVIDHINELFPTEESLGDVHDGPLAYRIAHIRNQVNNIDNELSLAVQEAAENRLKTQSAISETQLSIQDLFKKVKSIKEKAVQSEIMVEEICSDIRKLDNAKKNLSESITTLQKLHMLVSGVEQLQKDASTRSYDRASHLVQALNDLFMHFKDHLSLTQLKSLKLDMDKTREDLKKAIYRDFRQYDPKSVIDAEEMSETLRNACEVIDVMGSEEQDEFVEWISSTQLQAYGAIFSPGGEKSGIEYLERRFEWLKNQLLKYNKNYARIFPRYWNVSGNICKLWCDITHKHLVEILLQSAALNALDMNDMVRALEQCVSFEKELQRLYSVPSFSDDLEKIRISIKNLMGEYDEDELYSDPITADKIKIRYKLEKLKKQLADCESQIERENNNKSAEQKERESVEEIEFMNVLSCAFSKYMHYYVELEKQSIADVIADIAKNEEWNVALDAIPNEARYGGIDDLLGYIKSSIHRCAKIGGAQIFYKIYFEYRDGLIDYVDLLKKKVSVISNEIGSKNRSGKSIDTELVCLTLIVNTLDYLSDTLQALQGKLRNSMTDDSLANKIELKDIEEGKSDDLAAKTVKCIAQMITQKIGFVLDREVLNCRRWNEMDQSAERSSFLISLKKILNADIAIVHEVLVLGYHSLFNSQMSQRLIPRYIASIFRIKRMSMEGALQLQLDTRDFEKTMLNLPTIGLSEETSCATLNIHPNLDKTIRVPNAFKNSTSKQINRIQILLKTISSNYSSDHVYEIAIFFKDVSNNGNHNDLAKICEIKGLQKNEIQTVVTAYNRTVPIKKQSKPLINTQNMKNDDLGNIALGLMNRFTSGRSVFAKKT
eukprot:738169_1